MILITKEQFVKHINEIKKMSEIETKINEVMGELEFCQLSFGDYEQIAVNILTNAFTDEENGWISYFIYELDFGKKWHEGSVTEKTDGNDKKDIPLGTAEHLYNLLVRYLKN